MVTGLVEMLCEPVEKIRTAATNPLQVEALAEKSSGDHEGKGNEGLTVSLQLMLFGITDLSPGHPAFHS